MIKLIASDMDGTLLDENGQVPEETYGLIEELHELGVRFCVSSGRSYPLLRENFAPVADIIDYVCSNGSEVHAGGELIGLEQMSNDGIRRLARIVNLFDAHHLAVVGEGGMFICDDSQEKFERLAATNPSEAPMLRAFELGCPPPGRVVNTGWLMTDLPEEMADLAYILNLEMGDEFPFNYTSVGMDFSPKGVSKATGIRKVMEYHGLRRDEVVAYGDSMNDYEILRLVGHPVVVDNAFYAPTAVSERGVESNVRHGVQRDMARIIADLRAGGTGEISFGLLGGAGDEEDDEA